MPTINIPVGAAVTSGLGVSLLRRPSPGLGSAVTVGYAPSLIKSTITYTSRPGRADFTIANVAGAGDLTTSQAAKVPDDAAGLYTALDVASITGATTVSLAVKLQRLDHVSGKWIDIAGASYGAKTATGTDDLILYPGVAETGNRSISDHPGKAVRMVGTLTNASQGSVAYSLSGRWLK